MRAERRGQVERKRALATRRDAMQRFETKLSRARRRFPRLFRMRPDVGSFRPIHERHAHRCTHKHARIMSLARRVHLQCAISLISFSPSFYLCLYRTLRSLSRSHGRVARAALSLSPSLSCSFYILSPSLLVKPTLLLTCACRLLPPCTLRRIALTREKR